MLIFYSVHTNYYVYFSCGKMFFFSGLAVREMLPFWNLHFSKIFLYNPLTSVLTLSYSYIELVKDKNYHTQKCLEAWTTWEGGFDFFWSGEG